MKSLLSRFGKNFGMADRRQWAWAMYDWGNSAFATTIMAVLLPIYFFDVAAKDLPENVRTAYWGYSSGLSLVFIAVLSPFLGAIADSYAKKKFFLGLFTAIGVLGTAVLWFVEAGDWMLASVGYLFGNVGFFGGMIFYDSMLPHITSSDSEADRVSLAGYAMGYLGGGLLLALNLMWILKPEMWGFAGKGQAVRASFVSAALWWAIFTWPVLRHVDEPRPDSKDLATSWWHACACAWRRLGETFREIRGYRNILLFLIAFWLYSDGIGTIIKMATTYGREVGIDQGNLILAMLAVQILGLPLTFVYTPITRRLSAKGALILTLAVYSGICVLGYWMSKPLDFWVLAVLVSFVQGGSQALSRSIFSNMIPKSRSSEFFSFFSVSSKFAGILGPIIFGAMAQITGNGRTGILFLISFFVIGSIILLFTDLSPLKRTT